MILLFMYSNRICSQIELSKELEKSPTTIELYLKKLVDLDIIEPVEIENGLIYRPQKPYYIRGRKPIKSELIYRGKDREIT